MGSAENWVGVTLIDFSELLLHYHCLNLETKSFDWITFMHESRLFYSSPRSSFSEFRGMTLSWDSIEWLKDNFSVQDVVVGFYIVGKYSPSQQRFAEAEFQDSVKRLVQVGSREAAEWATSTIANDYEILRKKDVLSFWKKATSEEAQALETNQSNEWTIKFYQAADFQGKGKGKGRAAPQLPNPPPPATRLEQQQADGVYVAGLGNSIGTYIRAVAEGQVTHYDQATQRGKYFIWYHSKSCEEAWACADSSV
ncbi:hypothetical protein BX666DRAFT_1622737 [Dichotomocladium elegans]|nr:hypothetical protein BX666DRAFT_1622737 [Dichotomocladium elegans]